MKATLAVFLLVLSLCLGSSLAADRTLAFALKQRNLDALERLFWQRTDPTHADYAKWMTRDELAQLTGASDATIQDVTQALNLFGAKNVRVAPSREYILAEFSNTFANVVLKARGHPHAARKAVEELTSLKRAPTFQLPQHGLSHVEYVMEVTESLQEEVAKTVSTELSYKKTKFAARSFQFGQVGDPNSQKKAYGMPTDLKVQTKNNTQAVWGPGTFGVSSSDLASFYSYWSVPADTSTVHTIWHQGVPGGDNFGEGTLDATYISSMGLGATTYIINSNTSMSTEEGPGFGYALENFMLISMAQAKEIPFVLSMSLGSLSWDSCNKMCELGAATGGVSFSDCMQYVQYTQRQVCMMDTAAQTERINREFMKIGLRGTTLLAATGDGGSHYSFQPFPQDSIGSILNQVSCTYNFPTFPSASPFVLGVGGTQWNGAPSPSQPIAWSASGSGFSWRFPRPSYQDAAVSAYLKAYQNQQGFPGTRYFNASNRAYPDVAALADNVPMWMQGFPTLTGGTSASTPAFAGIITMINDARFQKGLPSLGFVNPRLYQLNAANPGVLFYDVTSGNSACASDGSCCNTGFPAATGWDPVTGLGSPLWSGLLRFLSN